MSAGKNIQARANESYSFCFGNEMRQLLASIDSDDPKAADDALEQLQGMPLGFGKVVTDHRNETIEWEILLGTGGPANRVMVVTDFAGRIESAEYQFQDWFEPWTTAENQDEELVQCFAEVVGFYEDES